MYTVADFLEVLSSQGNLDGSYTDSCCLLKGAASVGLFLRIRRVSEQADICMMREIDKQYNSPLVHKVGKRNAR